jgi:hypothetical protein
VRTASSSHTTASAGSPSASFSAVRPGGQHGVDEVERDGAALLDAERLQFVDDVVGGLPRDVGGDLVAFRVLGSVAVYDEVRHARISTQ